MRTIANALTTLIFLSTFAVVPFLATVGLSYLEQTNIVHLNFPKGGIVQYWQQQTKPLTIITQPHVTHKPAAAIIISHSR